MKNPLKYLDLWQKKRNELPVDLTPEQDWVKMRSVLDKHLPAVPQCTAGSGSTGGSGTAGFKAISLIVITLSAATAVYYFTHVSKKKQRHHAEKHYSYKSYVARQDSLSKNLINIDSLKITDQVNSKNDSLLKSKTTAFDPDKSISDTEAGDVLVNANTKKSISQPANKTGRSSATGNISKTIAVSPSKSGKNLTAALSTGTKSFKGKSKYLSDPDQRKNPGGSTKAPFKGRRLAKASGSARDYQNTIKNKETGIQPAVANLLNVPVSKNNDAATQVNNTGTVNKSMINDSAANVNKKNLAAAKKPNITQKQKNGNAAKSKNPSSSNFDFGILTGVNLSGSFTAKKLNANFYGSLPFDLYFGLFATYNNGGKWAVNAQVRALTPQKISGSYTHLNGSSIDSNQTLKVADTRKAYFISIPLHAVYKVSNNISIKAGPVINIPVKQITESTTLLPANIKSDSAYYAIVTGQIKNTSYQQKINFGLSGGISVAYKRLFFEANYSKGLSGYNVKSGFGNYKANSGSVQVTIGFSLKKTKK